MDTSTSSPDDPPSMRPQSSSWKRWLLILPSGVTAYLLVIVFVVLVRGLTGKADERDRTVELIANAVAAFAGSVVTMTVAPAHRSKVGAAWTATVFLVACYGNLVAGFVDWSSSIKNILVISGGGGFGCLAAKMWLVQRWENGS